MAKKNAVLITDFDGTLYDPSVKILLSPYYGLQITRILQESGMPFVVNTGRSDWTWFDELQLALLGYQRPDMVICGSGTYIYKRNKAGKLLLDKDWNSIISSSSVHWKGRSTPEKWSYQNIRQEIHDTLQLWNLSVKADPNPFMIMIPIFEMPVKHLKNCMDALRRLWKNGLKILLTEKLYLPNSTELFNGYMLLIPENAGKDRSSEYILKKYFNKPDVLFFGDALIDVPMLAMGTADVASNAYSYGVHMTPLARENLKIADPKSKIMYTPGSAPKAFLKLLRAYSKGQPIAALQHAKIVEPQ